jgi:DNA-binding transcriptional ArsR family regulator
LPSEVTETKRSNDHDLLVALRHPLRRRILRAMSGLEEISPRELSAHLRAPLSNVAYHVRILADCAAVTLVRTVPVRGSTQHFYSPAVEAPWARRILGLDELADGEQGESSSGAGT